MKSCHHYFLLLSIGMLLAHGCGGPKTPADMPKLYPVKLTILQEDVPLEGAMVVFHSSEPAFKWSCGGITQDDGVVEIMTHGQFHGAPAGKYKITVSKERHDGPGPAPMDPAKAKEYQEKLKNTPKKSFWLVEEQYRTAEKTPLELEVNGSVKESFNVGKAVEIEIPRN